ncbi:MAG: DsbA family protein [Pseudomonadota bacterium]
MVFREAAREAKLYAMKADMLPNTQVTVYYDPLCGWCYGATPSLHKLGEQPGVNVELVPTGLFAGANARAMDARFAEHAWSADQRIERLTGQRFSNSYREQVLADRATLLDSRPATVALTAIALTHPTRELHALEAIQKARYVEGRDVTDYAVLAPIIAGIGLADVASRVAAPDSVLLAAYEARTENARRALQALGATGVPTLVVRGRVLESQALYGPFEDLLRQLQRLDT